MPSIHIPYHCSSGLTHEKAIPGECSPSVYIIGRLMTIKISESADVLLEWNYQFVHLGIEQVQFMLKIFLFNRSFLRLQSATFL